MSDHYQHDFDEDDEDFISKTQIKREMLELVDLAERVLKLKPAVIKNMDISDRLRYALAETKRIKNFNARKRHMQFIGKLLRDHDLEAINSVLDMNDSSSSEFNRIYHQLESWRDRLIEEGKPALIEFMQAYPAADMQHVRQLARNCAKELDEKKRQIPVKKLFKYLRELSDLQK